jgi:hypothetical protein
MSDTKSSISGGQSYEEIGAYWDNQDLSDHWDQTEPAHFEVHIRSQATYFAVASELSERLRASASRQGVAAETLLNMWLQERIIQEDSVPTAPRL